MNDPIIDLWTFRKMITPTIIRWVFVVGLAIVPIVTACIFCEGCQSSEAPGRIFGALVCSVFLLPLWRIVCELAIVAFSINDRLGEIVAELKKRGQQLPL